MTEKFTGLPNILHYWRRDLIPCLKVLVPERIELHEQFHFGHPHASGYATRAATNTLYSTLNQYLSVTQGI